MVDIVVAQIQNRRGLRRDLPQPLTAGELGLCTDTGQLFIGADPDDPASVTSLIIELNTPSTATQDTANTYINSQLIQYDFITEEVLEYDPNDGVNYDPSVLPAKKLELQAALGVYSGFDEATTSARVIIVEFSVEPTVSNPGFNDSIPYHFRGYVVFGIPLSLPPPMADPATSNAFFGIASGVQFIQGRMDLSNSVTYDYIIGDSGAVSTLMNEVYLESAGLVNIIQNIEIYTDFTDLANFLSPKVPFVMLAVADGTWTNIPGVTLDLTTKDSFVLTYSVKDVTGGSPGTPATYSRVGNMYIVTDGNSIVALNDIFTEVAAGAQTVEFQSIMADSTTMQLQYRTTNTPPDLTFVTSTEAWKSF